MPLLHPTCEVRAALREKIWDSLRVYSDAAKNLHQYSLAALDALDSEDEKFMDAQNAVVLAKQAYDAAREELRKHIAEHGCHPY